MSRTLNSKERGYFMKKKPNSLVRAIAVATLGLCVGIGFTAQSDAQRAGDEKKQDDFMLEEIIVTAQGREQNLNKVPVSVSVFKGEYIDNFNITSLQDVSVRMPNVNIVTGPIDFINIRGVGSGNNSGFQQSVGIFVDGIYHSRSRSSQVSLFDIDRVEVLKGPQTTFFGANSIAGALNITTRAPRNVFGYNASALYGTDGEYNVEAGVDVPIVDTLSARVAARVYGMDGYIDTPEGDVPEQDAKQVRLALEWKPTARFQSDFRGDYGTSDTQGALAYQLVGCPAPDGTVGLACANFLANNGGVIDDRLDYHSDTPPDFINFEFYEVVWTNTFDILDSSQLIFKTGYYWHESPERFTGIPFPSYNTGASGLPPFLGQLSGTSDGLPIDINEEFDQWSQEVRFQSNTGGFFDYMVGAYYSKSKLDLLTNPAFFFNDFGAIAATLPVPNSFMPGEYIAGGVPFSEDNETKSAFVNMTFRPMDRLTVNMAGRYSRFEKEAHRGLVWNRTDINLNTFEPVNAEDSFALDLILGGDHGDFSPSSRNDERFMPSVSLQYDLTDDVMGYVSYSEGFKAGGFSTANTIDTFDPEYVKAYEAGLKGTLLKRRLMANLIFFYNEYSDMQETSVITSGVTIVNVVRNAAAAISKGVEFDASILVTENLILTGSVALLDSKYENFPDAACTMAQQDALGGSSVPCTQDLSGKQRAFSPNWSGNIGAQYTLPVGDYDISIEPLVYFSDGTYLSSEIDPWLYQDAFAKVDLRIGLTPGSKKWGVALIGKNLTDEITASVANSVTGSDGSARYFVDRPRSVAVQISLNY